MSWRYQPVRRKKYNVYTVTLCEVYFDADGRLESWTGAIAPAGDTIEELFADLHSMMEDASEWKVVNFDDLRVGMTFERLAEDDIDKIFESVPLDRRTPT